MSQYIVADENFWNNLNYFQELTCGRVRFTRTQQPRTEKAEYFDKKGSALFKVFHSHGAWLIYETKYADDRWVYEKVIGTTSKEQS